MPLSNEKYEELERAGERIKGEGKEGRRLEQAIELEVYVCPTEGCGNYFGARGMGDLAREWTGMRGLNFEPTPGQAHTRARCPDCFARGRAVERVRIKVPVVRPAPVAAPENPYL